MSPTTYVVCIKQGPIKDAAGLRGENIGYVWPGVNLTLGEPFDKWCPILGPADLGPTWKKTGKQGWIEQAHTRPTSFTVQQFLITVASDGTPTIEKVE